MTVILGFYGSTSLKLGPNCSRLITQDELFVQSIELEQIDGGPGPILYGFYTTPTLDVETTWTETHNASIQPNFQKEWVYNLNPGSKLDISYDVKDPNSLPLSLIIAQDCKNGRNGSVSCYHGSERFKLINACWNFEGKKYQLTKKFGIKIAITNGFGYDWINQQNKLIFYGFVGFKLFSLIVMVILYLDLVLELIVLIRGKLLGKFHIQQRGRIDGSRRLNHGMFHVLHFRAACN